MCIEALGEAAGKLDELDPQLDRVIMLYKGFTATVENHLQYEDAS